MTAPSALPPGPPPRGRGLSTRLRYGYAFITDPIGFVGGRFGRYGDVYYAPSTTEPLYVFRHPDHLRVILSVRADSFEKDHTAFRQLRGVLGNGLLTTDGDTWLKHRRLLNPQFVRRATDGYVDSMAAEAERTAEDAPLGRPVDAAELMIDLTLRIVGRTLLGTELGDSTDRVSDSMRTFQRTLAAPSMVPGPLGSLLRWRADAATAELHAIIDRVIRARRSGSRGDDLLQRLLDAVDPEDERVRLSEADIRDHLVTFLLAGHETTSNTLTWTLGLLARDPVAQAAVRDEIRSVVGAKRVTADDVRALPLTESAINEAMRLYPPVYLIARRAKQAVEVGGYTLPAGAEAVLWIYFTHRDPRFFPKPDAFVFDRFANGSTDGLHKHAYVPFGAGPRACIGRAFATNEAIAILATLLARVRVHAAGRPIAAVSPRITLSPKGGMPLVFERVGGS